MNYRILNKFYKQYLFIFLLITILFVLLYVSYQIKKQKRVEALSFGKVGKAFKKVGKAVTGAAKTAVGATEDLAKKAAEEAKKAAEAAAAEAQRLAEEAAMILKVNELLKDFNNGVNRMSDAFVSIGTGIGEIKGLGSDLSNTMKSIPAAFDKLS